MAINSVKFSKGLIIAFCILYFLFGALLAYLSKQRYNWIQDQETSQILGTPILYEWALVLLIFIGSVFGFVAVLRSSPLMIKIFAFLALIGLVLQILDQFLFHVVENDLNLLMLRRQMSFFTFLPDSYKELYQEVQQSNRCCGVNQWRDYGPMPSRAPDSCCGKYFGRNFNNIGSCSFEELEVTSGCGGGLFLDALQGSLMPVTAIVIYNVVMVLFYGFQSLTTITAWILGHDLASLARKERG